MGHRQRGQVDALEDALIAGDPHHMAGMHRSRLFVPPPGRRNPEGKSARRFQEIQPEDGRIGAHRVVGCLQYWLAFGSQQMNKLPGDDHSVLPAVVRVDNFVLGEDGIVSARREQRTGCAVLQVNLEHG